MTILTALVLGTNDPKDVHVDVFRHYEKFGYRIGLGETRQLYILCEPTFEKYDVAAAHAQGILKFCREYCSHNPIGHA